MTRRCRGDGGGSTLEVAILMPAVLLLFLAAVQYGIYFHVRAVAGAAARHGADAARVSSAGPGDGESTAHQFLDQVGGWLVDRGVRVRSGGTDVAVSVSGEAVRVLPAVPLDVVVTVHAPLERIP